MLILHYITNFITFNNNNATFFVRRFYKFYNILTNFISVLKLTYKDI